MEFGETSPVPLELLDGSYDPLQNLNGFSQGRLVFMVRRGDLFGQCAHTALPALQQQFAARGCCSDERVAAVCSALGPGDKGLLRERIDNPGHCGRTNLLGGGEIAQRQRTCEDDDGQGRQARRVEAAAGVFAAELAKEMNGGGVDLIGNFLRVF